MAPDIDAELLLDLIFGAIYYRLLLRSAPLSEQYGEQLVSQAFRGLRTGPDVQGFPRGSEALESRGVGVPGEGAAWASDNASGRR